MATSCSLFLAVIFTVLQIVECTRRGQNSARSGSNKAPLQWWVLPVISITGFVVTFLVLYFIKKLFSGERTIKIRNSLRNRPQSPWRTTINNSTATSDHDSDVESADMPPEYEQPPSYIEVTKEFEPPPPPAYDIIFKGISAPMDTDLLAELPTIDTELGACGGHPRSEVDKQTSENTT